MGTYNHMKIKGAQERGAVGCLIYSDLRDDGTVTNANGYSSCVRRSFLPFSVLKTV